MATSGDIGGMKKKSAYRSVAASGAKQK